MSAPPFLQLFPADYLKDTCRLTTRQHGAYFLLIMEYWVHGGLPDDDRELAAIARLSQEDWLSDRAALARYFGSGWVHGRIERDLAKAQEKNTRRVEAGKAGATARHTQDNRNSNAKTDSNATSNDSGNALASSSDIHKGLDTSLRSVSAKPRKSKSVKTEIPEDAQPSQADRDHATKVGMPSDVFRFQWVKFRDHHLKKGDKFASWPAAWRTWCAGWIERGGTHPRAGPRQPFEDGRTTLSRQLGDVINGYHSDQHHQGSNGREARAPNAGATSLFDDSDERHRGHAGGQVFRLAGASPYGRR